MQAWRKLEVNSSRIHFSFDVAKRTATHGMSQMGFRTLSDVRITKIHTRPSNVLIYFLGSHTKVERITIKLGLYRSPNTFIFNSSFVPNMK